MLKRLWHALVSGHDWKFESGCYCPGVDPNNWAEMTEVRIQMRYGFTERVLTCNCGARKNCRAVGRHGKVEAIGNDELTELRKMAGL